MPRLIRVFAGRTCHFVDFVAIRLTEFHSAIIRKKPYNLSKFWAEEDCILHSDPQNFNLITLRLSCHITTEYLEFIPTVTKESFVLVDLLSIVIASLVEKES